MKITTLLTQPPKEFGSRSRRRVRQYMNDHPDEVFTQRDEALASALGYHPNTVAVSIWELFRQGLIDRERVDNKYYYGSHEAIEGLRQSTRHDPRTRPAHTPEEAFRRIGEIREQIRSRVGRIDTLALLDAARKAEGMR